MVEHDYTAVSLVYEADFPLLLLQARSMALYASADRFRQILVVDNTRRGLHAREAARLASEYSHLSPLIDVVHAQDLGKVPETSGWWRQQVLKLLVSQFVTGDRYLVLDAKNLLVAPLRDDFLEAPDGRARLNAYSYVGHPLQPRLEHVLRYLGVEPERHVKRFSATVTPFVMETALVEGLIADTERTSGRRFADEFLAENLTEFFLYSASIIASGKPLEEVHSLDRMRCPNVWPKRATLEQLTREISEADEHQAPFFTVHQRAMAQFDSACATELSGFWVRRGLMPSADEAATFFAEFRQGYARAMRPPARWRLGRR